MEPENQKIQKQLEEKVLAAIRSGIRDDASLIKVAEDFWLGRSKEEFIEYVKDVHLREDIRNMIKRLQELN